MNKTSADKIFINSIIFTNDDTDREMFSGSLAVKDGRILYVGDNDVAAEYKGSNTEIYDLKGAMILPGMIDCHIHPPGNMLYELFDIDLYGKTSRDEILKGIRDFIKSHPNEEIYYGSGFHMSLFSEGSEAGKGPRKEYLDEICSDKAIIINSEDMHSSWANSKAFEIAGINADTPDPEGGRIERCDDTGEPWGVLRESSAMALMPEQKFSMMQKVEALEAFQRKMNSWGYTGMVSLSGIVDVTEALALMAKEKRLRLRTSAAYYFGTESETDLSLEEQFEIAEKWRKEWNHDTDLFKVSTIKIAMDGVVEGVTAALIEPYAEAAGMGADYHGELQYSDDDLEKICYEANKRGFQIHIHSIGDLATKKSLDAFRKVLNRGVKGDFRNVLTHLQVVDEKDIKRFNELNVIAATQPYWMFKEPGLYDKFEEVFLGSERSSKEYPLASFIKEGVTVTASSDHGVTPVPYPFFAIETGVTRNMTNAGRLALDDITSMDDPRYLLNKNERATVKDMIKAFTSNAAYQCFWENETGTLETGKFADFVVIDKNILDIDPLEIEKVKVLKTVFNGNIVYECSN